MTQFFLRQAFDVCSSKFSWPHTRLPKLGCRVIKADIFSYQTYDEDSILTNYIMQATKLKAVIWYHLSCLAAAVHILGLHLVSLRSFGLVYLQQGTCINR